MVVRRMGVGALIRGASVVFQATALLAPAVGSPWALFVTGLATFVAAAASVDDPGALVAAAQRGEDPVPWVLGAAFAVSLLAMWVAVLTSMNAPRHAGAARAALICSVSALGMVAAVTEWDFEPLLKLMELMLGNRD